MALTKRRQEMYALVEAYGGSSQSRKDFCAQHRISVSTFSWWQHEYRKSHAGAVSRHNSAAFLPIAGPRANASVEYQFGDGSVVRIPCSVGQAMLVSILQGLRTHRCLA